MKTKTQITTQAELRQAFWRENPNMQRSYINGPVRPAIAPQNYQPVDTRVAFCDYVDALQKAGEISEALAERATL